MKRGLIRLIIFLFFATLLYFGSLYQDYLQKTVAITYNAYPLLIFRVFFPITLGLLLSTPQLFKTIKGKGKLLIDVSDLIFIGIPAFYIAIMPLVCFIAPINLPLSVIITMNPYMTFAAGVTLGYILVNSFEKTSKRLPLVE